MSAAMPVPRSAPPALPRSRVAYLVYRLERRLRIRIEEAVRDHGLTTTEYVTLSVLRRHDGMSCAELARWTFVTPQAMNQVISALERRGLVSRRPDSRHARTRRTSVTADGLQVLDRCDRCVDVIEADMLGDMPPETVELLGETLARCARALEATLARRPPRRPAAVDPGSPKHTWSAPTANMDAM
jgi:DNA-binding MarR family transcriptional regulator